MLTSERQAGGCVTSGTRVAGDTWVCHNQIWYQCVEAAATAPAGDFTCSETSSNWRWQ